MLRPVTEVVGSKQRYYAGKQSEISRTAGWVNVMLHTEVATRDSERAFVRYADLLDDWTVPVFELGERLATTPCCARRPRTCARCTPSSTRACAASS